MEVVNKDANFKKLSYSELSYLVSSYNSHCNISNIGKIYESENELLVSVDGYEHDDGAHNDFRNELQYYKKFGNNGFSRCDFSQASEECKKASFESKFYKIYTKVKDRFKGYPDLKIWYKKDPASIFYQTKDHKYVRVFYDNKLKISNIVFCDKIHEINKSFRSSLDRIDKPHILESIVNNFVSVVPPHLESLENQGLFDVVLYNIYQYFKENNIQMDMYVSFTGYGYACTPELTFDKYSSSSNKLYNPSINYTNEYFKKLAKKDNQRNLTMAAVFGSKTNEEQKTIADAFSHVVLNPERDIEAELRGKVNLTDEEIYVINMSVLKCRQNIEAEIETDEEVERD